MSHPIWPVVTENLAEQLSAAQGGIVHPAQLLPYLPLSLELIEQTLDELACSDRVDKQQTDGLTVYIFKESLNKTPHHFAPRQCVYSNEPLDDNAFSQSYFQKQREIMIQVYQAVRVLRLILENHPQVSVSGYQAPDWLRDAKFYTY